MDFRNAIIVMTTNIGAEVIKKQTSLGFQLKRDEKTEERQSYEEMRKKLTESLKKVFRPEFINRLDSVIVFRSLNKDDIRQIVTLELNKVTERLAEHEVESDCHRRRAGPCWPNPVTMWKWAPGLCAASSNKRSRIRSRMPCCPGPSTKVIRSWWRLSKVKLCLRVLRLRRKKHQKRFRDFVS